MKKKHFLAFAIILGLVAVLLSSYLEGKNLLNEKLIDGSTNNMVHINSDSIVNSIIVEKKNEETIINDISDRRNEQCNSINLEQSEIDYNKTLDDVLSEFQPSINVSSIYSENLENEELSNGNLTILLPSQGQYHFEGNITEIESQYIQNPGAETEDEFYSSNAINAGLSFEKIEESSGFGGSYAWKFFSSNTETMSYALYQKDIELHDKNTKISYNYKLEANSSIKNVVNSSLIFDLVFDTCRIMVIHWHYTNINPPLIGENTTSPFIVYRLLKNSSWNNEWRNYSLELSELFNEGDPYIPTIIKSVGVYVISPEFSECSLLIDNFEIKTSVSAEDIELKVNGFPIISIGPNSGIFSLYYNIEDMMPLFEYTIYWGHNSSFTINAEYDILISGTVEILTENQVSINENEVATYSITQTNLSLFANIINVTYPVFWNLNGEIENFDILFNGSLDANYNLLSINNTNHSDHFYCEFTIPNLIINVDFSSLVIFETLDVSFNFSYECTNNIVSILWFSEENGGTSTIFENNTLIFTFPPWIINGDLDVIFIIIDTDSIGFTNASFFLERLPAQLQITNQIVMPQYALTKINTSYLSLITYDEVENGNIIAYLDSELIDVEIVGNQFQLLVSSYYLTCGDFILSVIANSTTHSTVVQNVNVHVYESEMLIEFSYKKLGESEYQLSFGVFSDFYPVGFAPVMIESNTNLSLTGFLDLNGKFAFEVDLPPTLHVISITCSIIRFYTIMASETFEITFEHLQAEVSRNTDDVFISSNISIVYDIHYMNSHDKWYSLVDEDMLPILDAFIQTDSSLIPVYIDSDSIFWGVEASEENKDHKLIITTLGPDMKISINNEKDQINCNFIIGSYTKSFSDLSLIYYLNDSFTSTKYQWKLLSSTSQDTSRDYNLQINDIYIYMSNINITKGNFLILNLVGIKVSGVSNITNLVVPLVSSSGILAGAITTIIKIYNKKKGMILEI